MKNSLILFLISISSIVLAQEMYVFQQYNSNFTVSLGEDVGSYVRAGQQMLFEDSKSNRFECVRLGKVINYKTDLEFGSYKTVGLHSAVYESNKHSIYIDKEGDHYILSCGDASTIVSKVGTSYVVELLSGITEEIVYKFGIVLVYHLLDGT